MYEPDYDYLKSYYPATYRRLKAFERLQLEPVFRPDERLFNVEIFINGVWVFGKDLVFQKEFDEINKWEHEHPLITEVWVNHKLGVLFVHGELWCMNLLDHLERLNAELNDIPTWQRLIVRPDKG